MNDFLRPNYTDLETFVHDNDIESQCFRYWIKGVNDDSECCYGYIKHIIEVTPNIVMVGISDYDERYEDNAYPLISYYNLNDISFAWYEGDQEN